MTDDMIQLIGWVKEGWTRGEVSENEVADVINSVIDQRLAHHGGKLLTTHGDDGPEPNPVLASAGGFLLTLGKAD